MSLALRGLPHSEEAERSVLGSLFRDPRVVDDVVERLEEGDFYDERHRIVFSVVRQLHLGQKQVDLVTVSDKLRTDHKLEPIGGDAFLMDLADGVLSTAGVEGHCDLIRQKACLRPTSQTDHRTEHSGSAIRTPPAPPCHAPSPSRSAHGPCAGCAR